MGFQLGKTERYNSVKDFFLIERHCPLKKVMFLLLVHVISSTDPSKQLANFDFTKQVDSLNFSMENLPCSSVSLFSKGKFRW